MVWVGIVLCHMTITVHNIICIPEREREKVGEAARGWLDEWVAG